MEWAVDPNEFIGTLALLVVALAVGIYLTYPKTRHYTTNQLKFKTRYPEKVIVKSDGFGFLLKAASPWKNFKIKIESSAREVQEIVSEFQEIYVDELLSEVKTNSLTVFEEGSGTFTFAIPAGLTVYLLDQNDLNTGEEMELEVIRKEPWWTWLTFPIILLILALFCSLVIGLMVLSGIKVTFV